ncbi:hypothetical protein [Amycolatopsis sp. CA-230715]|uniref:hypothetical protein n=1 Tax=Amycolatopsis sp. CA-230715 TaxID=2745196 RepID=UPI001C0398AB|nr:hypothetical protein [Amycolatopsis sp. CA-230715]QWF80665.1 hypothetical protein HUW46_04088 [Amycolatopsis sp. CA-230715]
MPTLASWAEEYLRDQAARHSGRLAGQLDNAAEWAADRTDDLAQQAACFTARFSDQAAVRIGDYAVALAESLGARLIRLGDRFASPEVDDRPQ